MNTFFHFIFLFCAPEFPYEWEWIRGWLMNFGCKGTKNKLKIKNKELKFGGFRGKKLLLPPFNPYFSLMLSVFR